MKANCLKQPNIMYNITYSEVLQNSYMFKSRSAECLIANTHNNYTNIITRNSSKN